MPLTTAACCFDCGCLFTTRLLEVGDGAIFTEVGAFLAADFFLLDLLLIVNTFVLVDYLQGAFSLALDRST